LAIWSFGYLKIKILDIFLIFGNKKVSLSPSQGERGKDKDF
jgi:hypothetical protein